MHRFRQHHLRWALTPAIIATLLALPLVAAADTGHGRPDCTGQLDELGYGTRDGFDHQHATNTDVFGSLADLEGYLSACRTNDSTIVEAVSASARAVRVAGVTRVQLRAQLQQWLDGPDVGTTPDHWETVASSASVNTGVNRTLTVTTPTINEVGSTPPIVHTWTRANVRALIRYANGSLVFEQHPTYAVWVGDGPVSPAVPPT